MFKFVFLDTDDTILDFLKTEHNAIAKTFREFGLDPTEDVISRYSAVNLSCWERFERGELTREQVMIVRFEEFFAELGVNIDPHECDRRYCVHLGEEHIFVEGAEEMLNYLAPKYHLYIASNGFAKTQEPRLESAGIVHYFDEIFISERTGFHKPEKGFFDYCFARIPDFRREEAIIIGDSLSSDIQGGINAGIATCWFNLRRKPARDDITPDYTIYDLEELKKIL